MNNKHLKITQKGMERYTGPLGVYEFVDGLSVEVISGGERDRISASVSCVEISENGKEVIAGVAERLVIDAAERAPKAEKLKAQSVEDKVDEERALAVGDTKPVKIYTDGELDEIIDEGGIAALRRVADVWNVKNRSIPTLRQMVLDEQAEYLTKRGAQIEQKMRVVEEVVRQTEAANGVVSLAKETDVSTEADDESDDVLSAAMSGDMAGALAEEKAE